MNLDEEKTEEFAARIHKIWSRWFLHYSKNATPENMRHWAHLAHTAYIDLPETEKEKDRKILRELLAEKDSRKIIV